MSGNGDSKTKSILDWAFRILSVLIIPIMVFVGSLQSTIAVQNEKIARLEQQVKDIETNKLVLVRLESELKSANEKLEDIKSALHRLGSN